MATEAKVWLITGCSSGFGLVITEYALSKGDNVVATLRRPEVLFELAAKHPERLLVVKLDVTKPAEVTAAFAAGRDKFGRVDVVVNNAGFGMVSEVEGTNETNARSVFEVNFWGTSHVSKEAVRFFREENKPMGGRLLQVSSLSGIQASPGLVYYCASKFALEGFSEGLAAELSPEWNIKVTLLVPGPFRTKAGSFDAITDPIHPAYSDPLSPTMKWRTSLADSDPFFNGDPDKFAEAVYKAAYLEDPPMRLPIHSSSIGVLREKGKHFLDTADKWESWSEDVLLKD